jgi:hypothetical protein
MSRAQRLTFLGIAAVIAVVAVIVLAGSGDESASENTAATATPTATGTAAPQEAEPQKTATPKPPPPPLLTADKVTDLKVTQGDTVRFRVRSDADEEVHVHGYDLMKDVTAGETATMSFKATITGVFDIEFEHSATEIAKLTVEPG